MENPVASKQRSDAGHAAPSMLRGWTILVGISVASTLGLAAAVLPLLSQHSDSAWPWARTQLVLLVLFPVAITVAMVHLSREQRRAAAMLRNALQAREREAVRARRHSERLGALLNVGRIMGTETHLQSVFDSVTQICREAFGCEQVSLMLVDTNAQELVVRSASGHKDVDKVVGSRQRIGEGVAGSVAANGKPVVLGPGAPEPGRFRGVREQADPLAAALVVPILVRDELVGVLNVASHAPGASYDEEDCRVLQVFAENVGSCIRHAEQAEWMRQLIHRYTAAERNASSAVPGAR
jgi:signal transduction protein with GAF and PtsI domain